MILSFSTIPIIVPETSYSPLLYNEGISAVSPPISAQSFSRHPSTKPEITCSAVLTSNLPVPK